ncbi:MAG: ankyrin repeat domain-containing protein, partial [Bacteroidota bacterium]
SFQLENGYVVQVEGATALMIAIEEESPELVRMLIEAGADVNTSGEFKMATIKKRFFVRNGKTIDLDDLDLDKELAFGSSFLEDVFAEQNWTPLMMAAYAGNAEVIRQLLAAGADANAKTSSGKFPLMVAQTIGNRNVYGLLK